MKAFFASLLTGALTAAFFLWGPLAQSAPMEPCVTPATYLERVVVLHGEDSFTLAPVLTGRGEITAFLTLYPMASDKYGIPNGFWLIVNTTHDKALIIPTIDGCLLAYRNLETKPETLALTLDSIEELASVLKEVAAVLRRSRA